MARELLRAHVSAGGQGSDVVDLLCPELADGKLDRLVDLLPALIHARLEDSAPPPLPCHQVPQSWRDVSGDGNRRRRSARPRLQGTG